ncbi:MAG: LysE family translocator [Gammaproteobacteria bacterium]|nr:LysE family translocator [Gammaproteobacteria bacterium]
MLPEKFSGFLALSLVFILMPGPNVLVISATAMTAGRTRGLQTVAGVSLAMAVQLALAALATSSVLMVLHTGLFWLKWLGVGYLLYLAAQSLYLCWRPGNAVAVSAAGTFQRGFFVSLTNPKTIFFLSAFLPQFVSSSEFYVQQIALLSTCFWVIAVLCDSGYAMLAAKLNWLVTANAIRTAQLQNGLSGTLYLVASGILANMHKSQSLP